MESDREHFRKHFAYTDQNWTYEKGALFCFSCEEFDPEKDYTERQRKRPYGGMNIQLVSFPVFIQTGDDNSTVIHKIRQAYDTVLRHLAPASVLSVLHHHALPHFFSKYRPTDLFDPQMNRDSWYVFRLWQTYSLNPKDEAKDSPWVNPEEIGND